MVQHARSSTGPEGRWLCVATALMIVAAAACQCGEELYFARGELRGTACDPESGMPLVSAAVRVRAFDGTITSTDTDARGDWMLAGVLAGAAVVSIGEGPGQRVVDIDVEPGQSTTIRDEACDFELRLDAGTFVPGECVGGETRPCYPGPAGTENMGVCRAGLSRCEGFEGSVAWGPCEGAVTPGAEICGDGIDTDCDGIDPTCGVDAGGAGVDAGSGAPDVGTTVDAGAGAPDSGTVDAGAPRDCTPGVSRPCYSAPSRTNGVGICRAGVETCDAQGRWGSCIGEVTPRGEICNNGIDEDCNGSDCACVPATTRPCYSGPGGTQGVGICRAGTQQCDPNGQWGACSGAVTPAGETCGNGIDEDCDGQDEACPPVEVPLFLIGDCVTAFCPSNAPYPVGCNVFFSPGDPRGCVANVHGSSVVFFKAGDECDQGLVLGSLWCSQNPGPPLGPQNCPINKPQPMWVSSPSQCPW